MEKAFEAARRAKCLADQRTIVLASRTYADDNRAIFPPHLLPGVTTGNASSWDMRTYNATPRVPIGLGLLPQHGYLPATQLGKVVHCPSLYTMSIPVGGPGHNMDVVHSYGVGGSYWTDPRYADQRVIPGFQYRASSFYLQGDKRDDGTRGEGGDIRTTFAGSSFVVSADVFDWRVGINYHHVDGYNRAFADGSAGWFSDPEHYTEITVMQGNATDGVGNANIAEDAYDHLSVQR